MALTFFAFAGAVSADSGVYGGYGAPCQPIYGGGETCITVGSLLLNKTVQNPQTKAYVDNLSLSNDPKFGPNQKVEFRLSVTNTGDNTLSTVTVNDTLPSYLKFSSGPGTYDANSKTLTFDVFNLKANETRNFNVEAVVVDASGLPTAPAVNCVVNQAKATSGNSSSSDISQVCVQNTVATGTTKGGLPVMPAPKMSQTPATGAESLALVALIPSALAGFVLRRRSK